MAKNKNLIQVALFRYNSELAKWVPFNPDIDINGGLVVSSYAANPVISVIKSNDVVSEGGIQTGVDVFRTAALTNSAQAVKALAGLFKGWFINNPNASFSYVDIFNVVAADVVIGTTVPRLSLGIPANAAANFIVEPGIDFSAAISVAAVTAAGGGTAPGTNLVANLFYR